MPIRQDLQQDPLLAFQERFGMGSGDVQFTTASTKSLPLSASLLLPQPQEFFAVRSADKHAPPNALSSIPGLPILPIAAFQPQSSSRLQPAVAGISSDLAVLPSSTEGLHASAEPSLSDRKALKTVAPMMVAQRRSDAHQQQATVEPAVASVFATSPGIFAEDAGGPSTPDTFAALMQDLTGLSGTGPPTFARPSVSEGKCTVRPQMPLHCDQQQRQQHAPNQCGPAVRQSQRAVLQSTAHPPGHSHSCTGTTDALNQFGTHAAGAPSTSLVFSCRPDFPLQIAEQQKLLALQPLLSRQPASEVAGQQTSNDAAHLQQQHVQPLQPLQAHSAVLSGQQQQPLFSRYHQQPHLAGLMPPAAGNWTPSSAQQGLGLQYQQDMSRNEKAGLSDWGVFMNATPPGSMAPLQTSTALPLPAGMLPLTLCMMGQSGKCSAIPNPLLGPLLSSCSCPG